MKISNSLDIHTTLSNVSVITFLVDKEKAQHLVHERFKVITVLDSHGQEKALCSVVNFKEKDFHFKFFPFLKFSFPQTDYRLYVEDTQTQEKAVWFLSTTAQSVLSLIPRFFFSLPWRYGRYKQVDKDSPYSFHTQCLENSCLVEVEDLKKDCEDLSGFSSVSQGKDLLLYTMKAYYYTCDHKLGSYSIWHGPVKTTEGKISKASFSLLERRGLWCHNSDSVHSVLLCENLDFTVKFPPQSIKISN